MQTPSHFLVTWFLVDRLRSRIDVHMPAALVGSVAPDIPLFVLTAWYFAVPHRRIEDGDELFGSLYDAYFFHDPVWIASHNLLHAPFVLLVLAGLGVWAWRRNRSWGHVLTWFVAGCALHALIDTFTHHDDGPLLLFPFDWFFRFDSPVSYWHPDHYGRIFMPAEMTMNALILVYFGRRWVRSRARG